MGIRDSISRLGRTALGAFGEVLTEYAGESLAKAKKEEKEPERAMKEGAVPVDKATEDPKSLFWDPYALVEQLGYKDRPSMVTYGTLRAMVWKMPIVQAIIQTRLNQIAAFCSPEHDPYKMGFRLALRDSEKEPTKAEMKWITDMESVLMRTGVTDNIRGRDGFEDFMRKVMYDSLVLDQMTFEVVPNRKGKPAEWYAVDASTIRLADTATTHMNEDLKKEIRYVQIYDGMIISEYTQEELCFGVRNPRTDLRLYGYGVSELEMLIPIITSLLFSFQYNQNFFTQGSAAKGIINFKGTIPERQLQSFRRQWYSQIAGTENAWRTPITNSEDLQWINLQQSARDMEFSAWMDFLIKVTCSCFTIDPVEVNFQYGNSGQKASLVEASNKEKITESKERGLRPLMRFFATAINKHIIWPINEDFVFEFVGLDSTTRAETADLATKQVKSYKTVDEIRAMEDLPPLPDKQGEIVLDPVWMQNHMASQQGGMEEGEEGGMTGEEFGGEQEENAGEGEEGKVNGKQVDFQTLLSQYEEEGEEEEKSLTRSWVVEL
jgi:hypothetical protein